VEGGGGEGERGIEVGRETDRARARARDGSEEEGGRERETGRSVWREERSREGDLCSGRVSL